MDEIDLTLTNVNPAERPAASQGPTDEQLRSESRLKALKLILFYLQQPAPNISHLFLGMDIKKPLTDQKFYPPGTTIGATVIARNCLHSIVRLLNKLLREPELVETMASSVDMAYEIMYTLCTCPLFNQELLAFLRTEYDFVYRHLKLVPVNEATRPCDYLQNCWVMSLVCVEMQSLAANKMRAGLKRLTQLLVENSEVAAKTVKREAQASVLGNRSAFLNQSTFLNGSGQMGDESRFLAGGEKSGESGVAANSDHNNKMFDILAIGSFVQEAGEPLNLNYFGE